MERVVKVFGNSVITELMMRPSHSSTEPLQHATTFTPLKLASLKPSIIRVSDKLAKHYTVHFQELWEKCFEHVLGQWRYENGMANWKGPEFSCSPQTTAPLPANMKAPQLFSETGVPVESSYTVLRRWKGRSVINEAPGECKSSVRFFFLFY